MSQKAKAKWDAIYANSSCTDALPSAVLQDNIHLLPKSGTALDLACGLGANALLLAQCNLTTYAWDLSTTALQKLTACADEQSLNILTEIRDVEQRPPENQQFDVIVASHFLHRPSFAYLKAALKFGGLLFYQTFTVTKVTEQGPSNPNFLLNKNELLQLCAGLDILVYREEGTQGNVSRGWRNQAMIIACKSN